MSDTFETIKHLKSLEEGVWQNIKGAVGGAIGKVNQMGQNLMQAGVNATQQLANKAAGQPTQQAAQPTEQPQATVPQNTRTGKVTPPNAEQQAKPATKAQPKAAATQKAKPAQPAPAAKQPAEQKPAEQPKANAAEQKPQQSGGGGKSTQTAVGSLKKLWNMSLSEATQTTYDKSFFHYYLREADDQKKAKGGSIIGANYKNQAALMKKFCANPSADQIEPLKQALTQMKGKAGPNSGAMIDQVLKELDAASKELQQGAQGEEQQTEQATDQGQAAQGGDQAAQQGTEQPQAQQGDPSQELLPIAMQLSPKMLALKQQGKSQFTKEDVGQLEKFVGILKKSVGG